MDQRANLPGLDVQRRQLRTQSIVQIAAQSPALLLPGQHDLFPRVLQIVGQGTVRAATPIWRARSSSKTRSARLKVSPGVRSPISRVPIRAPPCDQRQREGQGGWCAARCRQ